MQLKTNTEPLSIDSKSTKKETGSIISEFHLISSSMEFAEISTKMSQYDSLLLTSDNQITQITESILLQPDSVPGPSTKRNNAPLIIGIVLGIVILIAAVALISIFMIRKKRQNDSEEQQNSPETIEHKTSSCENQMNINFNDDSSERDINFYI